MSLTIFGEHPLETDAEGKLKSRIGTLFVDAGALVTLPRMTHAMQHLYYTTHLDEERAGRGRPPLSMTRRRPSGRPPSTSSWTGAIF